MALSLRRVVALAVVALGHLGAAKCEANLVLAFSNRKDMVVFLNFFFFFVKSFLIIFVDTLFFFMPSLCHDMPVVGASRWKKQKAEGVSSLSAAITFVAMGGRRASKPRTPLVLSKGSKRLSWSFDSPEIFGALWIHLQFLEPTGHQKKRKVYKDDEETHRYHDISWLQIAGR